MAMGPLIENFQLVFQACGCNSRCFHCSVSNEGKGMEPLPLSDIRQCVGAAISMNERTPPLYQRLSVMWLSEPADYPELVDLTRLRIKSGGPTCRTLATNGERLAREPGLLAELKAVGLEKIQLSFYGADSEHDKLEGRRGAWDQKLRVARAATELGLVLVTQVFLRRGHASEVVQIIRCVDEAVGHGTVDHSVTVWIVAGRGSHLDRWVPTQAEFDELPENLRALPRLSEFKPESEWCRLASEGTMADLLAERLRRTHERGAPDVSLHLGPENIRAAERILEESYSNARQGRVGFEAKTDRFCNVPLPEWAESVGRPSSSGMYTVLSMRQEWERRLSDDG